MEIIAEGVKGSLMISRESLVAWARRRVEASEARRRGLISGWRFVCSDEVVDEDEDGEGRAFSAVRLATTDSRRVMRSRVEVTRLLRASRPVAVAGVVVDMMI